MVHVEHPLLHDIVGHVWFLKPNNLNYLALKVENVTKPYAACVYGMCLETGKQNLFLDYYHNFERNLRGVDSETMWKRVSIGSLSVGTR